MYPAAPVLQVPGWILLGAAACFGAAATGPLTGRIQRTVLPTQTQNRGLCDKAIHAAHAGGEASFGRGADETAIARVRQSAARRAIAASNILCRTLTAERALALSSSIRRSRLHRQAARTCGSKGTCCSRASKSWSCFARERISSGFMVQSSSVAHQSQCHMRQRPAPKAPKEADGSTI